MLQHFWLRERNVDTLKFEEIISEEMEILHPTKEFF